MPEKCRQIYPRCMAKCQLKQPGKRCIQTAWNEEIDRFVDQRDRKHPCAAQVTKAVADAVGAKRVGHRISPFSPFMDALDSNPIPLSTYLSEQLSALGIALPARHLRTCWRE